LTGWGVVFLGIIGTAFASPLIGLVYGSQYDGAAGIFRVLIWLIPLALVSGHYRYALIAADKQRLEFLTAACGAALNILLNLALIPSYGASGAAWALLISEAFIWGLAYYFTSRTIARIPCWPHIYRPLLGGIVLAGALSLLPPINLWVAATAACVIYPVVLSIVQPKLITDLLSPFVRNR
jgi:O-antigen/teichoic acid export membrane protein